MVMVMSPSYHTNTAIRETMILLLNIIVLTTIVRQSTDAFLLAHRRTTINHINADDHRATSTTTTPFIRFMAQGFGGSSSSSSSSNLSSSSSSKKNKKKNRLVETLKEDGSSSSSSSLSTTKSKNRPFVKSEQEQQVAKLIALSAQSCIGQAVATAATTTTTTTTATITTKSSLQEEQMLESNSSQNPFWELLPALIISRFPHVSDDALRRVAGFVRYTLNPKLLEQELQQGIIMEESNEYRPMSEMHAYMPGLGPTQPFHTTIQLPFVEQLEQNYEIIKEEYNSLIEYYKDQKDPFQSVTSMNYDSGWGTLILFYNGHRIPSFPYHLCPITTQILETVPLGGRIAGFNRQRPLTGIPLHTDGNNMWLTCQMGVYVPPNEMAYIRVGNETKYWKESECIVYDTTYQHETRNNHKQQERVVLHVDFFNTLAMTPIEIEVMQYIYSVREEFLKAEGSTKVGAHIL